MRTAAICPTCATYTNAVCVLYDGPYLSNLDISPLTNLEDVVGIIDAKVGTLQPALGFTPENVANKSTNTSLGTSNTLYPTQNAVKTYVDGVDLQKVTDVDNYTSNSIQAEGGYDIWDSVNLQWIEVRGSDGGFKAKVSGATHDFFISETGGLGIGDGAGTVGNILIRNLTASANKSFDLPNISTSSKTLVTSVNGVDAGTDGNVTVSVSAPYTVYSALVSFNGSVASALVLENTLGVTLNWTNPSNGILRATAASGSPFTSNKTWISSGSYNNAGTVYFVASQPRSLSPTQAIDFNFFLHDGTQSATPTVTNFSVEIRVYP